MDIQIILDNKLLNTNKLQWKSISLHDISITWKETVLEHFTIHNLTSLYSSSVRVIGSYLRFIPCSENITI
jgi:hypothetical protein